MATTHDRPTTRGTRFGPRSAGRLLTPEQFDATPAWAWERGYRYELINGVLVVAPFAGPGECDPNDELGYLLRRYHESRPEGRVLDVTVPELTVPGTPNRRRADRLIWAGLGRLPDAEAEHPTIVVEFVSGRWRDAVRDNETKRDEYLAAGVKENWIIDRFRRIMTVYRPDLIGPTYEVVTEAQTYRTGLLPGFELPLARLLSKADRWKKTRPRPRPNRDRMPPAGGTDG
jgi:Uma2 family endonuclease